MLKKAVQQGRSERRGEEVHTALRVGRSPLEWILANGKSPSVPPTSEKPLLNVEPLSDARTPLADFFSILLNEGTARTVHVNEFETLAVGIFHSSPAADAAPIPFGLVCGASRPSARHT
jgi:hypothetical protein